jgi:hypothetical protein
MAERAALAVAIRDAQAWLLPSLRDRAIATDAIAERFTDLATSVAQAETGALPARIAAARDALDKLSLEPPAQQSLELGSLGLVLDDVEGVIQGRLRPVPLNGTAQDASSDAPPTTKQPKRPTSDRSLP